MLSYIKPIVNYVVNFMTRNDPKPAQVHAKEAANRAVDNMTKATKAATDAAKTYQKDGAFACATGVVTDAIANPNGNGNALLFAAPQLYRDYQTYRYLAGQTEPSTKYKSHTVNTNEDGSGFDFEDISVIKPFNDTREMVEAKGLNVSFIKLDENPEYPTPLRRG